MMRNRTLFLLVMAATVLVSSPIMTCRYLACQVEIIRWQ